MKYLLGEFVVSLHEKKMLFYIFMTVITFNIGVNWPIEKIEMQND